MTQTLFETSAEKEKARLESGLFKSTHKLDAPLWIDGSNVIFEDGKVRKARGWTLPSANALLFDDASGMFDSAPGSFDSGGPAGTFSTGVTAVIRGIHQQKNSDGSQNVFFGTVSNLYRSTGGAASSVGSGYTGQLDQLQEIHATQWSMVSWGDWCIATNGVDATQVFKGSSFAALGSTTFTRAQIVCKLGPFLLAFNTSNGEKMFEWCKQDDPEAWSPTTNATAGNLTIREFTNNIIAAIPLGQSIAVFEKHMMALVSHRGAPFIFGYRIAQDGIGALSKHSVVTVGRNIYGWGPDGIWVTDGSTHNYIDYAIKQYIKDNLNVEEYSKIWAFHDEERRSVVFFYPKGTSTGAEPTEGLSFNYEGGGWTILGYGRTAADQHTVWDGPIAATATGGVFVHNQGVDANGSAISFTLQSKPLSCARDDLIKYASLVRLAFRDVAGTVNFQFGVQDSLDDSITYTTATGISDGFDYIYPDRSGVFFTLYLAGTATGTDFSLTGAKIEGEYLGPFV